MHFDDRDIEWLTGVLADAAEQEIMPRFRRLGAGDVQQKKSAADLVTQADINAERVITQAIAARYPDALVIGEEACEADRALLPKLGGSKLAFVIDPVDGTYNFASGVPVFGVILAVVRDGETVAGIIYDPVGKDAVIGVRGAEATWSAHKAGACRRGRTGAVLADDRRARLAGLRRTRAFAARQEPGQVPVLYRLPLLGA